jgi:hypothetical protein
MECPNCHHTGNLLKRPFVRRKGLSDQYCVKCGARVRLKYHYGNIALLVIGIVAALVLLHIVLKLIGYPGVSGGMAGSITGVLLVIFMQKPPFLTIEQVHLNQQNPNK